MFHFVSNSSNKFPKDYYMFRRMHFSNYFIKLVLFQKYPVSKLCLQREIICESSKCDQKRNHYVETLAALLLKWGFLRLLNVT